MMSSIMQRDVRRQLNLTNSRIDRAIEALVSKANDLEIDVEQMTYPSGELAITDLLLAKSQILLAIVQLESKDN